jgi:hypothetical protein
MSNPASQFVDTVIDETTTQLDNTVDAVVDFFGSFVN